MEIKTPARRRKGNSCIELGTKKKIVIQRKVARELDKRYIPVLIKSAEGRAMRVIRIILECGMHPAVMEDPGKHNMQNERGELLWNRPKTGALCVWAWEKEGFPAEVLTEFLTKDLGFSRKTYWSDVTTTSKKAGLQNISPLTLRHTGVHTRLNRGESAGAVQQIWRASDGVLWNSYGAFRDLRGD